jgi:hypothetical protein
MESGGLEGWESFFVAQVGASAALAGLLFVGVSINLAKILAAPRLTARAFQALVVLLEVLVISSLLLVPRQPIALLGGEVLAIGGGVWVMIAIFDASNLRDATGDYRARAALRTFFSQIAALLYIAGGAAILMRGGAGVYWLVPAMLCSFLIAMLDAWVLLIEINR